MDKKEKEFLERLLAMFRVEAEEHLKVLSAGLIELEKKPDADKTVKLTEEIFREAHSLKGAARSVNNTDVESICQALESVFSKLKKGQLLLSTGNFDFIHNAIDVISKIVSGTGSITTEGKKNLIRQLNSITGGKQLIEKLHDKKTLVENTANEEEQSVTQEKKISVDEGPIEDKPIHSDTVRIQTSKLDPLFLEAEQMIQSKVSFDQRVSDLKNIYESIGSLKEELKKQDKWDSENNVPQLKKMVDWTSEKLLETERNLYSVLYNLEKDHLSLGRMIDDHVESMKKILMLPISTLTEAFPKLVRDLARSQDKDVKLIISGNEIEVDKRILESIKDPLVHLMRNSIDHGIEKEEERIKRKKTPKATITLSFQVLNSQNLEVVISDDGRGIDIDKVIDSTIKAGEISKESVETINEQEALSLVFKSGISTSPIITDISGRGLGLTIVREKVESFGGNISINNKLNSGVSFRLIVPLTLSSSRSVLVRYGEHMSFLPTMNVESTFKLKAGDIKMVENQETILFNGEIIRVIKLCDVLFNSRNNESISQKRNPSSSLDYIKVIVVVHGGKRIGFIVDDILGEYRILIKSMGKQLKRVKNIHGASILGSGRVVPVINIPDLMETAMQTKVQAKVLQDEEDVETKNYKILVTDDSVTSRAFIKNILEMAGYIIETAVDGVDAFSKATTNNFDLIVSDIDMPRMNGFELTAKIRKDKKLSELPVVLITALESREDKEHGIDVGANAYIIKSSFDQSNLLEIIKKLL